MIQVDTGEGMDLSGLFSATQIHTSDDGIHTDEDGHVYDAVTVDGELTFVPQEEVVTEEREPDWIVDQSGIRWHPEQRPGSECRWFQEYPWPVMARNLTEIENFNGPIERRWFSAEDRRTLASMASDPTVSDGAFFRAVVCAKGLGSEEDLADFARHARRLLRGRLQEPPST